jgi:hypothetical protein
MRLDERTELEFLASLVQGKSELSSDLLELLEPGYFTVASYQWLVRLLKERDWKPLPQGLLNQELLSIKDEQVRIQYQEQIPHLYTVELTFTEDAVQKYKEYISYCIINSTMKSSVDSYSRSGRVDLFLSDLRKGLFSAGDLLDGEALKPIDYASSYESRQLKRRSFRDNPTLNPRILTGIPGLDEQFVIKAPMLVDFMAPFKRYKSIFLNAMGYAALLQGFNVFHVTYENTVELTSDRYDAMFSELNYDRISNLLITEDERKELDRTFEWMQSWRNRLKIIKCVPKKTTVLEVEEQLERLKDKENFHPDLEIWDYLNLIGPSRRHKEERLEQGQIVWDLKNHADKFNVAVIEASQTKMEGVKSERLDLSHRGKAIDISQGINLSIAIDQTQQEKDDRIIVLSPHFTREGAITIPEIILDVDLPRMCISRSLYKLWSRALEINPYKE